MLAGDVFFFVFLGVLLLELCLQNTETAIMSVLEGAEEEEASNECEGEIFEGELFEADGINPMESLNFFRSDQFLAQRKGADLQEKDSEGEGEEGEDAIRDLLVRSERKEYLSTC